MTKVEGKIRGELKVSPIEYSEIFTRVVSKNNNSSGKITLPYDLINKEVVVILPIKKERKR